MFGQLELLTPYYYSTLGYDEDLIDYLNFVDDSFIYDLFPEYDNHSKGRIPNNPVTLFRMHYLYFTKPEFISFRQMCEELKKPKHQDYRNFIGVHNIEDVPSHTALSRFRAGLKILDSQMEKIKSCSNIITDFESKIDLVNKEIVGQAAKQDGFLNLMLGSVDSRPLKAKVGGFKKECTCGTPEKCKCPLRFSDEDAKVGRQRTKVNQNKFFIGYRKNTIIVPSSEGPAPITSVLVHAKTSDQNVTIPIIKQIKKMEIEIPNIIADMGYMDNESKIEAAETYHTILHTEVKKNMIPPAYCSENGSLECPEGNTMHVLDSNLANLEVIVGVCDTIACVNCFKYDTCDKEFILSMKENPHFYNPIPQGSAIQDALVKFRKQSELNFAIESNRLDSKFDHSKIPVKKIPNVDVYMRLADIFRLAKMLISFSRKKYKNDDYVQKLREMASKVVYQREYLVQFKEAV